LSEIEAGFKIVERKLDEGEKNSIERHHQTQNRLKVGRKTSNFGLINIRTAPQEMKLSDLMSKVSNVHEKIAFFEENLQSQHLYLEKMDNRTIESFSEVKNCFELKK